jgi:hypothetical protein
MTPPPFFLDPFISNFFTTYGQAIVETIPLLWLILICTLDLSIQFRIKSYFCETLDEIRNNMDVLRGRGEEWQCPNIENATPCPLFFSLDQIKENFSEECPRTFYYDRKKDQAGKEVDRFWDTILKGFNRFTQAAYFEVIFLQFFVVYLLASSITAKTIAASVAIFFAICFLFLTHFIRSPVQIIVSRKNRLIFAGILWFISFQLLII